MKKILTYVVAIALLAVAFAMGYHSGRADFNNNVPNAAFKANGKWYKDVCTCDTSYTKELKP